MNENKLMNEKVNEGLEKQLMNHLCCFSKNYFNRMYVYTMYIYIYKDGKENTIYKF